jgi:phosphoserine aminotransferase
MAEIPKITIPGSLLPQDGRFGSGPSRVRTTFVDDLAGTGASFMGTSHRRPGVKNVVAGIQGGLAEMYDLPHGYEIVLGLGGATAFWDAAVFGLIENRSAHFVCGEFSEKFASSVTHAPHLDEPVIIAADYGDAPQPEDVIGVDTTAFIHNETSTGVLAPFARLGDALVTVDGTSAAGAISFDVDSVDAYYFSPQKALGSDGGLWIALMSPFALDRIDTVARSNRWIPPFLSLKTAMDNSRKAQTYNTPALATLYLLARQIEFINDNGGIQWADSTVKATSNHVYDWAATSEFAEPFVHGADLRSPTVVTIDLTSSVSGSVVASVLRDNGILDTESYRKLGRNQLRIATFPNIPIEDTQALTACIDFVVEQL